MKEHQTYDETCPYCGAEVIDIAEKLVGGDWVNTECSTCESKLHIQVSIEYVISLKKELPNGN